MILKMKQSAREKLESYCKPNFLSVFPLFDHIRKYFGNAIIKTSSAPWKLSVP